MSILNCPYCGKNMMIGRVDLGGGDSESALIHESEEDADDCNAVFYRKVKAEHDRIMQKMRGDFNGVESH